MLETLVLRLEIVQSFQYLIKKAIVSLQITEWFLFDFSPKFIRRLRNCPARQTALKKICRLYHFCITGAVKFWTDYYSAEPFRLKFYFFDQLCHFTIVCMMLYTECFLNNGEPIYEFIEFHNWIYLILDNKKKFDQCFLFFNSFTEF